MRIRILNHSNASSVTHPVILVRGCLENYTTEVWRKHSRSSFLVMIHTHGGQDRNANEPSKLISEVAMARLQFKVLVRLQPGDNELKFDFLGVTDTLRVTFADRSTSALYTVRLVYVVCADDDGRFQSPPAVDGSVEAAVRRLRVAGQLLQCAMAELLWEHGLGRRTFSIVPEPGTCEPRVHVHRTRLTRRDTWDLAPDALWASLGRELVAATPDPRTKFVAWLSSTRYHNPLGLTPSSHSQTLRLTRGHIALGGGGLALFGTGCLWTWPTSLASVQSRLCDTTPVDPRLFMDDSGYRGTVGGCFATTLGAVLHELGHALELGHTETGIMARGFDDLDSLLTVTASTERAGPRAGQLTPCAHYSSPLGSPGPSPPPGPAPATPRFTAIRRSESVSRYLEQYSEKRAASCGDTAAGCHWTRSCALILAHHPWLQTEAACCGGDLQVDTGQVSPCCQLVVVELRAAKGLVVAAWCWDKEDQGSGGGPLELAGELQVTSRHTELVAVARCGNLAKLRLPV